MKAIRIALIAAVCTSSLVSAQRPERPPPPKPGELFGPRQRAELKLTEEQTKSLDAIQKSVEEKLNAILSEEQRELLKGRPQPDPARVESGASKSRDKANAVKYTKEAGRAAIEKALPNLWTGMEGHTAKRDCFTCHNHAVPALALKLAKEKGFGVSEKKIAEQSKFILDGFEAMRDRLTSSRGPGPSPIGGGVDNTAYALLAFEALGVEPNDTTKAVAQYTLGDGKNRDHWVTPAGRAPTESSDFSTTYLAMHGLNKYGAKDDREKIAERSNAVKGWLVKTKAKDTEDRVFRLLGLKEVGAEAKEIESAKKELLESQRKDGGWGQLDSLDPDAYATGTALYALHLGGGLATDDPAYIKGLAFLLGTQRGDGTWFVPTRSRPIQRYFETGFPYEKDQFISCAATGWATAALALASEKKTK